MKDDLVDALRQPEYTGENRCGACTAVNVVIAAVVGAVIARKSKLAGALAVGGSLGLIYLRGYLVPGTPTLTKRYLPAEVLRLFGKEPEAPEIRGGLGAVDAPTEPIEFDENEGYDGGDTDAETDTEADAVAGMDTDTAAGSVDDEGATPDAADDDAPIETAPTETPEEYFLDHDVVEPCEDVDDLCLTETFETAWADAIDAIDADAVDAADAATAFGLDDLDASGDPGDSTPADETGDGESRADDGDEDDATAAYEIESYDDARILRRNGRTAGKWPSTAALVADVTAADVLGDRDPAWDTYPPETKGKLLNGLRLFLETCPTSGGRVVIGEETVESCCQSHDVIAVTCEDTGERLFEQPVGGIDA